MSKQCQPMLASLMHLVLIVFVCGYVSRSRRLGRALAPVATAVTAQGLNLYTSGENHGAFEVAERNKQPHSLPNSACTHTHTRTHAEKY